MQGPLSGAASANHSGGERPAVLGDDFYPTIVVGATECQQCHNSHFLNSTTGTRQRNNPTNNAKIRLINIIR